MSDYEAESAESEEAAVYSVGVEVRPALTERNRLTTAFRFFLAIPHLILVGAPAAVGGWLTFNHHGDFSWSTSGGLLGMIVFLVTIFAWLAIVLTGSHPRTPWRLAAYYLRWRVRAIAYMALLRDEYPPFGDGDYPAALVLSEPDSERDRLSVLFRLILAIPHLIILPVLSALWAFTTAIAWIVILITGRYPETLYGFALGVLAWGVRVEAYLLLLRDEYPPFTLRA
jgi:hypothetical protein